MQVTEVRMIKFNDENNTLKAVCSIIINNSFLIRNIKLIRIKEKYIVAMPSEKKNGSYIDICNPINCETREVINNAIIDEYLKK